MRLAVLGLGFMGSTHLKALRDVPNAQLTAVYSGDARKLAGDLSAVGGNLGGSGERMDFTGVSAYTDLNALLADPAIEAVDLCLPTHLHESVTVAALRAGKHVLVEKPMALDGAGADRMIDEARRAGRFLMAAHVLRFWPEYTTLHQAVKSGDLGPLRFALLRRRCAAPGWSAWLGDTTKSGGGVFDLLIHDVDMCLHLFGMPDTVSAAGYEDLPKGIDCIGSRLTYGDACVVITGGWHHPGDYPFSMEFTVTMDRATIEFNSAGRPLALYGAGSLPPLPTHDAYAAEIEYFAACCNEGREPELCPPSESAAAVKLISLMLEARRQKGAKLICSNLG